MLSSNLIHRTRQRGAGLIGTILLVVVICFSGLVLIKAVPTYMEFRSIKSILSELEAQKGSAAEIRSRFDRQAEVNGINVVKGVDLIIEPQLAGLVSISAQYKTEVGLFGPIYLLLKYDTKSW